METLAGALSAIRGVVAVVLGGSRARGTHVSSSDFDLGLYYRHPLTIDVVALRNLVRDLDDRHEDRLATPHGGWGPNIDGGAWLVIGGQAVDLIYRDLGKVEREIDRCRRGEIDVLYQPGHPHAFLTSIYMAEVAHCRPLRDPSGAVRRLKEMTVPYPDALKEGIVRALGWEPRFHLTLAEKAADRGEVHYIAGCAFRAIAAIVQTLFAVNGEYCTNEKGAIALASRLPVTLPRLEERAAEVYAHIASGGAGGTGGLEQLVVEMDQLLESSSGREGRG